MTGARPAALTCATGLRLRVSRDTRREPGPSAEDPRVPPGTLGPQLDCRVPAHVTGAPVTEARRSQPLSKTLRRSALSPASLSASGPRKLPPASYALRSPPVPVPAAVCPQRRHPDGPVLEEEGRGSRRAAGCVSKASPQESVTPSTRPSRPASASAPPALNSLCPKDYHTVAGRRNSRFIKTADARFK